MTAATDPLAGLATVAADRAALDKREAGYVAAARALGLSWHTIGVALGRTSEGVRKRYGGKS